MAKKFVIIRHKKLKSIGHVESAIAHNDRTSKPPNADPSKTWMNKVFGEGVPQFTRTLAKVTRKSTARDPVLALEYIVTASPESMQAPGFDQAGYFRAAREYLDELLGAENFVHGAIHMDESNPHMHLVYVPLVQTPASTRRRSVVVGRAPDGSQLREVREFNVESATVLNGKHFTSLEASQRLQTEFAERWGGVWPDPWGKEERRPSYRDQDVLWGTGGRQSRVGRDSGPAGGCQSRVERSGSAAR